MGLSSSLRLFASFGFAAALALAYLLWSPSSTGANPAEIDRSGLCSASALSCGELCFYADCVHCEEGTSYHSCNSNEVCYPDVLDINGVVITPAYCEWVPPWSTQLVDSHSDYADFLNYTVPRSGIANPCSLVGSNVTLTYLYDDAVCLKWHHFMVTGNGESNFTFSVPSASVIATSLRESMNLAGMKLPDYDCRTDVTSAVDAKSLPNRTQTTSTPFFDSDMGSTLSSGSTAVPASSVTPTIVYDLSSTISISEVYGKSLGGQRSDRGRDGIEVTPHSVYSGQSLSLILDSLTAGSTFPEVTLEASYSGVMNFMYRYWLDTGEVPSQFRVPFQDFHHTNGVGTVQVAPADANSVVLGVYAFQVAVIDHQTGELTEISNVLSFKMGYDQAQQLGGTPDVAPTHHADFLANAGASASPQHGRTKVPLATGLPTLTRPPPPATWIHRPVTPGIVNADLDLLFAGKVDFTLSTTPVVGMIQYRAYHATGERPSELRLPAWRSRAVIGQKFSVYGLATNLIWEFEIRALDGGIPGNAGPSVVVNVWDPSTPGL